MSNLIKKHLPKNSYIDDLAVENASLDNHCPCGCLSCRKKRCEPIPSLDTLSIPMTGNNPPKNLCLQLSPKFCEKKYKEQCCIRHNKKESKKNKKR